MLSLQDDDTAGITFAGTTDLNLDCGLATNSTGSPAMTVEGSSARIRTTEMSAAGGLAPASNYLGNPKYFPGSPPVADPFEHVDVPPTSACQAARTIGGGANVSLAPGCFSGLDIAGTVSLAPGVYVIKDGPLRFAGNARVTGTGVTFVMTGSSGSTVSMLTVEGGATLNLTAPSSGDYAGLVFMQDRNAASVVSGVEATNSIAGNASITIKGSLYFPQQRVRVVGTGSLAGSCMRVVAKRIRFTGTSSGFAQSCPSDDDFRAYGTRVRLVD
jgi:hypothetical protein